MATQEDDAGSWVCCKCTLVNKAAFNMCLACNEIREELLPYYDSNEENLQGCSSKELRKDDKMHIITNDHQTQPKSDSIFTMLGNASIKLKSKLVDGSNELLSKINKPKYVDQLSDNSSVMPTATINNSGISGWNGSECANVFYKDGANFKLHHMKRQKSIKSMNIRAEQESEAINKWNEIVQICKQMRIHFVDDSFPPYDKSLTFSGNPFPKVSQWKRPEELTRRSGNMKWEVFRHPQPSDIIQGILGNCWFLSALVVLCEKPELLENIMITKEVCTEGSYQVRICKNGRWIIVMVDDLLPCDESGKLVFSQAARNQLWVPIIEKAVAKSFGCYESLIAGRCIEGLQMLTGCPCESIMFHNKPGDGTEDVIQKDMVWAKLLSSRNAGYLMAASCGGDISENVGDMFHHVGLEPQHAYSVLDIQDIRGHRLIRLRNPWGRGSWNGAWSDTSSMWTQELRDLLRAYGSDEGVFWISLEDMMKYFDCVDVCMYLPEWMEVTMDGLFGSPGGMSYQGCHLTVFAPTEVNITLFQESNRGCQTDSTAAMDLLIGVYTTNPNVSNPSPVKYVGHSERKIKPSILCNVFLDVGTYLIIPLSLKHWNSSVKYDSSPTYVLSIHTSKPVLVDEPTLAKYSYADALFLLVEKFGKKYEGIPGITCYYMSHKLSGLIVGAELRRSDVHLIVDCDCSNSFNVVSSRGELITSDCLPPMSRQVLTVLTQLEGSDGYAVSHKLKFRISPQNAYGGFGSHQYPLLLNGLSELHNPKPL